MEGGVNTIKALGAARRFAPRYAKRLTQKDRVGELLVYSPLPVIPAIS